MLAGITCTFADIMLKNQGRDKIQQILKWQLSVGMSIGDISNALLLVPNLLQLLHSLHKLLLQTIMRHWQGTRGSYLAMSTDR